MLDGVLNTSLQTLDQYPKSVQILTKETSGQRY